MNCKEFNDKLSLFIDNELDNEENIEFKKHIEECENCKKQYTLLKRIIDELNAVPEEELPEGYCKNLHNKLKYVNKKSKIKFNWKRYTVVAATVVLVFVAGFAYISSNKNLFTENMDSSASKPRSGPESAYETTEEHATAPNEMVTLEGKYDLSVDYAIEEDNTAAKDNDKISTQYDEGRKDYKELKIIKNGYVYVETEDYNLFTDNLIAIIKTFDGYIQNQETYANGYKTYNGKELKNGNMIIRVPQNKFYETIEYIRSNGLIRNERTNETDVTKTYYEKDNKVRNLEVQEERLRELLDKAENVSEILQIENELRRIRTEIDSLNIDLMFLLL